MEEYFQYMAPAGAGGSPDGNARDALQQPHNTAMPMGSGPSSAAAPFQGIGYFSGFPDPIMFQPPKPPSSRSRKKSTPGLDHVKHRRTRSGCYTCRSRRVKCDETRPICERCRKGNRECNYPEAPAGKSSAGGGTSKDGVATDSPGGSSPDEMDDEGGMRDSKLGTILDDGEPEEDRTLQPRQSLTSLRTVSTNSTSLNFHKPGTRQNSETPSFEGTNRSSPSVSTGTSVSFATIHPSDVSVQPGSLDWSHLPADMQFYLGYYCEHMTHYSYCVLFDSEDFYRRFLPSVALKSGNEALLNAVVGFAAYNYTMQNPNGQMNNFLQYYNMGVTLLLESFKRRERQNTATLLTILQLATIEEYLGDWVSLMGHQKAALQILTQIYTPQSIMQTFVGRMMLTWYVRFDVFVGMLGGFETRLPREWFSTTVEYCDRRAWEDESDLLWKQEAASAALRLISVDMSNLYAKAGRGEMAGEVFATEYERLTATLYDWRRNLDPALTSPSHQVTDFEWRVPLGEDDVFDPYAPGFLYSGPMFPMTLLLAEWHSVIVMHLSQEPGRLQQEPTQEMRNLALGICQIFASVERWPARPNGTLAMLHACLVIAALFLPKNERYQMWMRRKYVLIEQIGYICPLTIRSRMAQVFRDPSCINWWLPNDEGFTPSLKDVRAFADERNGNPVSRQTEDLREMASVFAKMKVDAGDAGAHQRKGKAAS